jgi:16S rRNA (guanine527-N7)-methyltransferase
MEIGSEQWKNILFDGAKVFDIHMDSEKANLFAVHASELLVWNRRINLTAVTDPFEIAVKHFVDSMAAARIMPPAASILDIGSGGGFPGIPLKILIPSLSVTLIDASRKKINFLKHIIRTIKLTDIVARQIRAEQMVIRSNKTSRPFDKLKRHAQTQLERNFSPVFDVIISRALSSLNDFIFMALPLMEKDGMIIAMRGEVLETEIDAARSYLSETSIAKETERKELSLALTKYKLPFVNAQRTMVTISNSRRLPFRDEFLSSHDRSGSK